MLATKLDALAKRLRTFGGEVLALARDIEDAAKALRGEKS
jgi:hypothetical protein